MDAAQNQHYVPKFVLRNFLTNSKKEQVTVFDKDTNKSFVTSIANIMAERRYNDFAYEDYLISFEGIASRIEDLVLPSYKRIIDERKLDGTEKERVDLAFFIAFQLLRTKSARNALIDIEASIKNKIEEAGGRMEDVNGWEPLTEDVLKRTILSGIKSEIGEIAEIVARKNFLLMQASSGRSYYLGDDPVCLHNSKRSEGYGNIGVACEGIEIYLPLSHDLTIAAWCPTILSDIIASRSTGLDALRRDLLGHVISGHMTGSEMRATLDAHVDRCDRITQAAATGQPLLSDPENMDFYNSLQVATALRYVICEKADFALARRFNKEFPKRRRSIRMA